MEATSESFPLLMNLTISDESSEVSREVPSLSLVVISVENTVISFSLASYSSSHDLHMWLNLALLGAERNDGVLVLRL